MKIRSKNMFIAFLILVLVGCAPLQPASAGDPPATTASKFTATPALPIQGTETKIPIFLPTQPGETKAPTLLPPGSVETQTPPTQPAQGVETPMPSTLPTLTPVLQSLADRARQDLAKRLSVPVNDITIIQAAHVTWSDSSLGCPQPGMAYTQVLVPGFLVVLGTASQQYEYHAGKDQAIFYCTDPQPPSAFNPAE